MTPLKIVLCPQGWTSLGLFCHRLHWQTINHERKMEALFTTQGHLIALPKVVSIFWWHAYKKGWDFTEQSSWEFSQLIPSKTWIKKDFVKLRTAQISDFCTLRFSHQSCSHPCEFLLSSQARVWTWNVETKHRLRLFSLHATKRPEPSTPQIVTLRSKQISLHDNSS